MQQSHKASWRVGPYPDHAARVMEPRHIRDRELLEVAGGLTRLDE